MSECFGSFGVALAVLDGQRSLAYLRDHLLDRECFDNGGLELEPFECDDGHHYGVELRRLLESGRDVAPKLTEGQIGTQGGELGAPSGRTGRDTSTDRKFGEGGADQCVSGIAAFRYRTHNQPRRGNRRKVLG